jgi:hypothetical protein
MNLVIILLNSNLLIVVLRLLYGMHYYIIYSLVKLVHSTSRPIILLMEMTVRYNPDSVPSQLGRYCNKQYRTIVDYGRVLGEANA